MKRCKQMALVLMVVLSCVGCDQVTKSYAAARLSKTGGESFLGSAIRLQLTYNEGAFLSLGASLPKCWRFLALRIGTLCVLIAAAAYLVFTSRRHPRLLVAVGLVVGGGVSNLADRFVHDGAVVDFMNLGIGSWRTGIFNVADVAITAGILLLLLGHLRAESPKP